MWAHYFMNLIPTHDINFECHSISDDECVYWNILPAHEYTNNIVHIEHNALNPIIIGAKLGTSLPCYCHLNDYNPES